MNSELVRKKLAGEELSDAEILAADIAVKRAEIETEANRRAEVRRIEERTEQTREQRFEKMLSFDRAAEAATRDLEKLLLEFDDVLLSFGRRFLQTKGRIVLAQRGFSAALHSEIPRLNRLHSYNEPELENALKETLETLKTRFDASLSSVCSDIWQPHLHYAPPFCRSNAYDYPVTNFGALIPQIEKMAFAFHQTAETTETGETEPPETAEAKAAT
jgi:hypothetical protein